MSERQFQERTAGLTRQQREAIKTAYVTGGEPQDLYQYITSGTLAFHNRERVINALNRRGLLDEDGRLTDAGLKLAENLMGLPVCTCKHDTSNGAGHADACPVERASCGDYRPENIR